MMNAHPIEDLPGVRAIRVPTFDQAAVVACPRCAGTARLTPGAFPGNTCPCGYILLEWVAFPPSSNVDYVVGLEMEIQRLRAGLAGLRIPAGYGGARDSGLHPWVLSAEAHNAYIDAILKGDADAEPEPL